MSDTDVIVTDLVGRTVEEGRSSDTEERIRMLVADGYEQISSKNRVVARLPEGMTGIQAIERFEPEMLVRSMERMEREAAERFRRFHAREHGLTLTLTDREFYLYRLIVTGKVIRRSL